MRLSRKRSAPWVPGPPANNTVLPGPSRGSPVHGSNLAVSEYERLVTVLPQAWAKALAMVSVAGSSTPPVAPLCSEYTLALPQKSFCAIAVQVGVEPTSEQYWSVVQVPPQGRVVGAT